MRAVAGVFFYCNHLLLVIRAEMDARGHGSGGSPLPLPPLGLLFGLMGTHSLRRVGHGVVLRYYYQNPTVHLASTADLEMARAWFSHEELSPPGLITQSQCT